MAKRHPLEPGEDSIDTCKVRPHGKGVYVIDFSFRPVNGAKSISRHAQGKTVGEARRHAREKVRRWRLEHEQSNWTLRSPLEDYIEQVTRPAIRSTALAQRTYDRYFGVLPLLIGQCSNPEHEHVESLRGFSIEKAVLFRPLERCLQEIARLHDPETARQARTVLSKYVLDQMIRDELIITSPIFGKRIDLSGGRSREERLRKRGGVAVAPEHWNQVLTFLLALDPAEGVDPVKRGKYEFEERVAKPRNAIDLAILQMMTGLRVSEANHLTWEMVMFDGDHMVIFVPARITKTKVPRTVYVNEPDVVAHFKARRARAASPDVFVIGSPAIPTHPWDPSGCRMATKDLYLRLADELGITELEVARTHVWRATLNTMTMMDGVPEVVRVANFGHSPEVNRQNYTDTNGTPVLAESLTRQRNLIGT